MSALGTIVSWRIPSRVPLDRLLTALAAIGAGPQLCPEMRPENAARRALREMGRRKIVRLVSRSPLTVQVTQEAILPGEATYNREARLELRGGVLVPIDTVPDEYVAKANALLQEHVALRTCADLGRLIGRICEAYRADLVPIRDQGGAYFIPAKHRDTLLAGLRIFLAGIGGTLREFEVAFGSVQTEASVAEAMAEHLVAQIGALRARIAEAERESTLDGYLGEISARKERLSQYAGLLGGMADQVRHAIDCAETQLAEMLIAARSVVA